MTGIHRTSHGLDPRRRSALYRAWRRGTREMDLLLGRFADARIGELSEPDLTDFEALLVAPDPDLYAWITQAEEPPAPYRMPVLRAILEFHESRPTRTADLG